ncbi:MAG: protein kinase [Lachnospiraceae bacterium]|nr:protein kinase [Lachnospiraceae bacterium]
MSDENKKTELLPELWNEDDYISGMYDYLGEVQKNKTVYLVRSRADGTVYVLRVLTVFDECIYRAFKEYPIKGTPTVYEIYRTKLSGEDCLVVIEEYIRGVSLLAFIELKAIDELVLRSIAYQLAVILKELHSLTPPVIHRDVKPDNILVMGDGTLILTDFNIARNKTGVKSRDTLIMGTEGYAAPEQFGFAESDERTDIYGFGATMREILSITGIDYPKMSKIVDKCTAIDPDDRFSNMQELIDMLTGKTNASKLETMLVDDNNIYSEKSGHPVKDPYALPGFRRGVPWHMIVAVLGYFSAVYISLSLKIESIKNEIALNFARVSFFVGFMAIIFFSCDYRGMRSKVKWMQGFSKIGKICATILIDIVLFIVSFVIAELLVLIIGLE